MTEAPDTVSTSLVAYLLRPAYVLPAERGVVVLPLEPLTNNSGARKLPL